MHAQNRFFLTKSFSALVFSFAQTLLDLGSSVNYKDSQSLTPLYHSVLVGGELACCLLLLRYSAALGCSDENGWTEMHQVGRNAVTLASLKCPLTVVFLSGGAAIRFGFTFSQQDKSVYTYKTNPTSVLLILEAHTI